ncbi:MAG: 3-phosphoshikimate 1-carboxyvinyltransferase, partial [Chloroflexi bacterium]
PFSSLLDGDPQLRRRPMRRVTLPLRQMGAEIYDEEGHAPLRIRGGPLQGITYTMPVASAQVKSALLLAGLYADGPTIVHQPGPSRDHTERMLAAMGVEVRVAGLTVTLYPPTAPLAPLDLTVPGDFSSAAFPLVAALLVPGSRLLLKGVNLNPTRTGLLEVLREMGAKAVERAVRQEGGEPVADLEVRPLPLRATTVAGERVVRMIDEFPIFAVAATQAVGETVVRDAAELRVKEVDRIAVLVQELGKMGAVIRERPDGFVVQGATPLRGAVVDSHGDHRLAMALGVAGLLAEGETVVLGAEAIGDSYPGFVEAMQALGAGMEKSQEED